MRWRSGRVSSNVEDRRRMGRVGGAPAVGGCGMLLVILIALAFGVDPSQLIQSLGDVQSSTSIEPGAPPEQDDAAQFVAVVLADTEDTWAALFAGAGQRYTEPTLVLFTDAVRSGCGLAGSATGPFYCPQDQDIYLDLGFLNQLRRLGIEGEFSVAYVIAHEVGHHVQQLLGTQQEVQNLQRQVSQKQANELSVLLELQADCYAGVWAHHADAQRDILDRADVEAGIRAAEAIGDDRMQEMAGQRVQPDAFTHGSSAQRAEWFQMGWDEGDLNTCDTFEQAGLRH